jgi:hypothetical protein
MGLLGLVAIFTPFIAAIWVGASMAQRGVRTWICWLLGVFVLVLGIAIFAPAKEALDSAMCRDSDDYEMCMDGSYDE